MANVKTTQRPSAAKYLCAEGKEGWRMQFASSDSLPPAPRFPTAYQVCQVVVLFYLAPFQLQSTSHRAAYHLALRTLLHVFLGNIKTKKKKGKIVTIFNCDVKIVSRAAPLYEMSNCRCRSQVRIVPPARLPILAGGIWFSRIRSRAWSLCRRTPSCAATARRRLGIASGFMRPAMDMQQAAAGPR